MDTHHLSAPVRHHIKRLDDCFGGASVACTKCVLIGAAFRRPVQVATRRASCWNQQLGPAAGNHRAASESLARDRNAWLEWVQRLREAHNGLARQLRRESAAFVAVELPVVLAQDAVPLNRVAMLEQPG